MPLLFKNKTEITKEPTSSEVHEWKFPGVFLEDPELLQQAGILQRLGCAILPFDHLAINGPFI